MKQFTVGYDAKRAFYNNTGLGNYSRRVIEQMSALHPEWNFKLFTPGKGRIDAGNGIVNGGIVMPQGRIWRALPSLWRVGMGLTSALSREKVDLYHGLSNELPLDIRKAGVPSVVTIHDVIYRRFPENYSAIDRRIYDYKYGKSARNATRVIAISECTKRDIVELYDVDPQKIDVIYQSTDPQFSAPVNPEVAELVKKRFDLPDRYVAMVGTVERRKNQKLVVDALSKIDPEVKLVIVGRSRQGYGDEIMAAARRHGVEGRIVVLDSVPFEYLPAIYSMAEVAAYVSRYEGFGLPVVEALQCGTPVIAAKGSCLEEAGGPGAIYVDADDADGFAMAANRLLESANLRNKMVMDGRNHIAGMMSVPMEKGVESTYLKAMEGF